MENGRIAAAALTNRNAIPYWIGASSLIFLAALFCAIPLSYAAELLRIAYGTTASPSHLPIWVAKDAGFFERHGLRVDPVQIRGGSLITMAIITGNLPFRALREK